VIRGHLNSISAAPISARGIPTASGIAGSRSLRPSPAFGLRSLFRHARRQGERALPNRTEVRLDQGEGAELSTNLKPAAEAAMVKSMPKLIWDEKYWLSPSRRSPHNGRMYTKS
jgi:hypothetical protein